MLVGPGLRVLETHELQLNAPRFRDAQARWLRLPLIARLAWAKERRVAHAVRVGLPDGGTMLVANLHATAYRPDGRLADAELFRAAVWVDALAGPDEPTILAGRLQRLPPQLVDAPRPALGRVGVRRRRRAERRLRARAPHPDRGRARLDARAARP